MDDLPSGIRESLPEMQDGDIPLGWSIDNRRWFDVV
jgi:hypothetical protein